MSKDTTIQRFKNKTTRRGKCLVWTAATDGRYGRFWDGHGVTGAHQFAYRSRFGDIPEGMVVMHTCDNPICVNADHLTVGTTLDNMRDMYTKGRNRSLSTYTVQSGDRAWNAKLSNSDAREIRRKYAAGGTSSLKLAAEYGVCKKTILGVLNGRTYKEA